MSKEILRRTLKVRQYTYRGIAFEERIEEGGMGIKYGYCYIPYRICPVNVRDELFCIAEPMKYPGGRIVHVTPVPDVLRDRNSCLLLNTSIAVNGCEWRNMEEAPIKQSFLMFWWDYNHYGWGPGSVQWDARVLIDNLINWINQFTPFQIICHSCGEWFDEGTGYHPKFGLWDEVCPYCEPKLREIKEKNDY